MKKHSGLLLAASAVTIVLVSIAAMPAASGGHKGDIAKQAAEGSLRAATLTITRSGKTISKPMPFLSDSTVASAEEALVGFQDERLEGADAAAATSDAGFPNIGQAEGTLGCSRRDRGGDAGHGSNDENGHNQGGGNVRVNQDCSFRRQAETDITYNPVNPDNLVGGQNDSRVGYNQCGIDWSLDNGTHWGDLLPPFRQRTNHPELMGPTTTNPNDNSIAHDDGTGHTYDAGSDPASAVDSQGRAYFSCVVFDVASNASGLYVTQSPQGADGSFYFNTPDAPNKRFMVVEDNSPITFHDKNMISADRYSTSPNHDNVYVTWTVFKFNASCRGGTPAAPTFCESPIFGSMSTDHGVTWSTPEEISGAAKGLCQFGDFFTQNPANANDCNFDQGSYSVALPNGDLELVYNNNNTPTFDGQQLGVHCKPAGSSTSGTAHLNCASPVKVGNDVATGEPACDFGRGPEECIPGPFIRTNDFPRITKDNTQNSHLSAVWQDYRNGEFDIQMSQSLDGGLTWREVGTVNPDTGLDHYFPATDQSPTRSDRIGVSYYRSERVANESAAGSSNSGGGVFAPCDPGNVVPAGADSCVGVDAGNSDYALAGGTGDKTPYDFRVLSPVFAPPDGAQAGFNGDYSGLTINRDEQAHPLWSDTRNADPFTPANGVLHDEDAFTDSVNLPNGKGKAGRGHMGH